MHPVTDRTDDDIFTHRWDLRLAGDCLIEVRFYEFPDGSLGSFAYPEGWQKRAEDHGFKTHADYGFMTHTVDLMTLSYREGYNKAVYRRAADTAPQIAWDESR